MNAIDITAAENKFQKLMRLENAAEAAIKGTRGAPAKRMAIHAIAGRVRDALYNAVPIPFPPTEQRTHDPEMGRQWLRAERNRKAQGLATRAGMQHDEHGFHSSRGDYLTTDVLDFVPARQAKAAPFFDFGNAGLALIEITRKRVYANSSKFRVGYARTRFVVGRNESGTFFAHAVSRRCDSLEEALDWIWSGKSRDIVRRQGDVAVVRGAAPKVPALPSGHTVDGEWLRHETHPAIRMPGKGERLIVGRRAAVFASDETRD